MVVGRDGRAVRLLHASGRRPRTRAGRRSMCCSVRRRRVYGATSLAVVMTGMGQDGLRGCEQIQAAGGQVIAQDEASSVVWGMPGFVARAGLAEQVLPLQLVGRRDRRAGQPSAPQRLRDRMSRDPMTAGRLRLHPRSWSAITARWRSRPARSTSSSRGSPRWPARQGFASLRWMVEPAARRADRRAAPPGRRGDDEQRDLVLPRRARRSTCSRKSDSAGADRRAGRRSARSTSGAPPARPGRSRTAWRCCCANTSRRSPGGTCGSLATDLSRDVLARARSRPLQPARSQPRPAGAPAREVLRAARARPGRSGRTIRAMVDFREMNLIQPVAAAARAAPDSPAQRDDLLRRRDEEGDPRTCRRRAAARTATCCSAGPRRHDELDRRVRAGRAPRRGVLP